jgi:hypothetical protein
MTEEYPTREAYEKACAALWRHRERAERLETENLRLAAKADDLAQAVSAVIELADEGVVDTCSETALMILRAVTAKHDAG